MTDKLLVERTLEEQSQGLLEHKWLVRSYLSDNKFITKKIIESEHEGRALSLPISKHFSANISSDFIFLLETALSPFLYLNQHQREINEDKSLNAVYGLCTDIQHLNSVYQTDDKLDYLSHEFNRLIGSGRNLLMCYDCGTVARGVFFVLIKAYRNTFEIRPDEIKRIKSEYYMDRYDIITSIDIFRQNIHNIKNNCLFLCALQLGENKFGHIYIIEKICSDSSGQLKTPRYRLYQSCHLSYMLIDYLELMKYAENPNFSMDIDQHIEDLGIMLTAGHWNKTIINLFVKWYNFYPSSRIMKSDIKQFASTYVIY